jgi:hypothetical protein
MVVGLCGNDMTMAPRLGPRVPPAVDHGVEELLEAVDHRQLAHLGARDQGAVDVDRVRRAGTSAASPGASSTHIRCEKPSLAPMQLMISVSGSSSTSQRRLYRPATASRSFGMPRLANSDDCGSCGPPR